MVESASRGTALFSGMKHIQGALDKVSLRSIAGTLKKVADGTAIRKISKADLVRAGWSDGFYEELIPWLRQNMTKVVGADGKARTIMNFAKMEPEMQARTIQGIQRLATADVQRMHLGELPLFMHKTTGKVLMQHRSFIYGSIEKQLIHGIKHNLIGFTGITLTCSAFASISHLTRTAARYYGTDEFDDKMQEAMDFTNPKTIFSVLQQTGTLSSSSMFLDALATFSILDTGEDTLGGMLGARSTSPRSVPSASMVSDLVRVPSTAVGILKGDKETVDLLKALHRVVPMARYFGVNQALNAIEADW